MDLLNRPLTLTASFFTEKKWIFNTSLRHLIDLIISWTSLWGVDYCINMRLFDWLIGIFAIGFQASLFIPMMLGDLPHFCVDYHYS